MTATGEPMLIDCEGSGCPPCAIHGVMLGMCAMCGQFVLLNSDDTVGPHQRDDIIARVKRGDFG